MDKTAVIKILARFHKEIEARGIRPLKVILYGSYVSDSNWEGSDIDIVVISDDFKYKSYWERIDILSDVIYEIFAPIEAIALTQDEWDNEDSFAVDFARNGEVLFAAWSGVTYEKEKSTSEFVVCINAVEESMLRASWLTLDGAD